MDTTKIISWSLINLTSCNKAALLASVIHKLGVPWAVVFDADAAFHKDTNGGTVSAR